jgi:hypothetical protein
MARTFLTEAASSLALAVLMVMPTASPAQQQASKSKQKLSEKSEEIIEWAKTKYKVDILYKDVKYPLVRQRIRIRAAVVAQGGVPTTKEIPFPGPPTYIRGSNPSLNAVERWLPQVKSELGKYPPELIEKTGLKTIILAREPKLNSLPVGGTADDGAFIVSVEDERGIGKQNFTLTFHHEFGHVVDIAMHGELYVRDVKWAALNGPKFRGYISRDGWTFMTLRTMDDGRDRPGFLSKYCTSCVQEDKAEVFGFMFANQRELQRRMKDDAVIRAKVQYWKEALEKFCPEMDEKFFEQLAAADSKKKG